MQLMLPQHVLLQSIYSTSHCDRGSWRSRLTSEQSQEVFREPGILLFDELSYYGGIYSSYFIFDNFL